MQIVSFIIWAGFILFFMFKVCIMLFKLEICCLFKRSDSPCVNACSSHGADRFNRHTRSLASEPEI